MAKVKNVIKGYQKEGCENVHIINLEENTVHFGGAIEKYFNRKDMDIDLALYAQRIDSMEVINKIKPNYRDVYLFVE